MRLFKGELEIGITREDLHEAISLWLHRVALGRYSTYRDERVQPATVKSIEIKPGNKYCLRITVVDKINVKAITKVA